MNKKQISGASIAVIGILCLFFSSYIMGQVEEGKEKISDAESKVGTAKGLFSLSPVTKELSKGSMESADSQIEEGKGKVAYYERLAGQLKVGGYVLIVIGAGVFFLGRKK